MTASAKLTGTEESFRLLLDSAPDAIVVAKGDGRILLVNTRTEELFGYAREDLLGQKVEVLLPNHLRRRHVKHRASYLRHPVVRPMGSGLELYGRRKDGTEFPIDISLSPVETGGEILVSAAIRDITDRKRSLLERERLIVKLQEALDEVKLLSGLLSICASCKKITNERGAWEPLESFLQAHSQATFSHGLCPDCLRKLYPEQYESWEKEVTAVTAPRGPEQDSDIPEPQSRDDRARK